MDYVARIGVSMDPQLLETFDQHIAKKGYDSRSEALRDLIRDSLAEEDWKNTEMLMAGTIITVCDSDMDLSTARSRGLQDKWDVQISTTTRVALDGESDLIVLIVTGKLGKMKGFTEELISVKGVRRGKLAMVSQSTKNLHLVGVRK